MNVQYGQYNFDDKPVDPKDLEQIRPVLAPYGPDAEGLFCRGNIGILCRALHTTKEARAEIQPYALKAGAIITWDGRLDNREELIRQLGKELTAASTDVAIVAAAYERWGTDCFAKLIGDWALSICDPTSRSLVLAKDFVGLRPLYYFIAKHQVIWSTVLDALVPHSGHCLTLDGEYIAGWLSFSPATHLTPYAAIRSVPPSHFVSLERERKTIKKYWDFDSSMRITYRCDADYEDHFRSVFGESVRRRLRADSPILAELSGGMDSSSIVCMADDIISHQLAATTRLDTVSYYDDSEPNWDERSYFMKVEERRGRTGCHINVGLEETFRFDLDSGYSDTTVGSRRISEAAKQFSACLVSRRHRVVLSGIGGDEVTGGVPTPAPELADLLARGHFKVLARQLKMWALDKRKPWLHLLVEAGLQFLPLALSRVPEHMRPDALLNADFARAHRTALNGYRRRSKLFGTLPSFQENLNTLDMLRRRFGCSPTCSEPPYEKRYPYLDRDLLEFLYAIPREQLVRPGQRRSLMRRALAGIVPSEILDRKRKAFVVRGPMAAISTQWDNVTRISRDMMSASLGICNEKNLREALVGATHGQQVPIVTVIRALNIEMWLRDLRGHRTWAGLAVEMPNSPIPAAMNLS